MPSAPTAPTDENYRFVGWCLDQEGQQTYDWTKAITGDVTLWAKWNSKVDLSTLLKTLLSGYNVSPYSFIPEAMQPQYSKNLVTKNALVTDYSKAVQVSQIRSGGFGEQWNMVVENIDQSTLFHNTLSVVDGIATASVAAFNNIWIRIRRMLPSIPLPRASIR